MRRLLVILLVASSLGFVGRGGIPCDAVESQPQCLVALLPGPTANTLDIVDISGDVSVSNGELLLTTVSVDPNLTFREWVRGSFDDRVLHLDRDLIYPEGTTVEQVQEANAQSMQISQLAAVLAAFDAMGTDVYAGAEIGSVEDFSSGADGRLRVGDVLVEVAGTVIRRSEDVSAAIQRFGEGDVIDIVIERNLRRSEVQITLVTPPGGDRPLLGVSLANKYDFPVEVKIDAGDIGGPSAGLMFALAIVDSLTPDDLTGGTVIAGTGEISPDGTVREIGGIQQKILGATLRRSADELPPATVFLVPERNMAEAVNTPVTSDILLVPVGTIRQALDALDALRAGQQPAGAVPLTS